MLFEIIFNVTRLFRIDTLETILESQDDVARGRLTHCLADFLFTFPGPIIDILRSPHHSVVTEAHFPVIFNDLFGAKKPHLGVSRLETPKNTFSECENSDQVAELEPVPHRSPPSDPQVLTDLGLLVFQISNKLSIGSIVDYQSRLFSLRDILKIVAKTTSKWESLLTAGGEATSRSLIEQLFELSINKNDKTLAEMMLRIGADPNQQMFNADLETRYSAIELAVTRKYHGIIDTLLNAGAVCGQMALNYAVIEGDFNTATQILESNPSLDVNFNYLDDLDAETRSRFQPVRLKTVSLLGLVCLHNVPGCDLPHPPICRTAAHINATLSNINYLPL